MGREAEKLRKEKIRARLKRIFGFDFSLQNADETPGASKKKLGRERPGEHVWAANRTNTRVAPAQIEIFVRGLFSG